MQLHQTTSPPTPVFHRPVLATVIGLVLLVLASACSSAGDYATEVSAVETGGIGLSAGDETTSADQTDQDRQAASAAQTPEPSWAPAERPQPPVLEVADPAGNTANGEAVNRPAAQPGSAETDADPAATDTEAATTPQEAAATQSSATAPPRIQPPVTQPPATAAPATTPPTNPPPATSPAQTAPPATDPPTADDPVAANPLAPPKPAVQKGPEPNCAALCNIAMEGDSLTVGLGNRLCGAVQTGNCINSGIVGRRVDEMIVTARSDVDNQLGSDGNDVLILWGGTNDLWQKYHSTDPASNAAAIYEQIKTFVAERRANGWDYVLVMTLPPMNPTYVVGTEPLNGLIRANAAGADGVLDVGADARLSNAFDPAMRAADGIHFGDGGRAVVMEYVFGAIRGLDGV